jgi:rfaE bifunctional protein nucleotidyltransferase chain/domain
MTVSRRHEMEPGQAVVDLEAIGPKLDDLRRGGLRVVLCHGTFDLLHIGHIKHFEAARKFGDILVVTLTADKHIKKGSGRPVFPEDLRAETIAALHVVDFVAVVDDPSAIPAIEIVRPNFYVKGSDYKNAEDDLTGKIELERKAVESHGGELVFTDEIMFSSSSLLNAHFGVVNQDVRSYLNAREPGLDYAGMRQAFDDAKSRKILFIGETIIDEYVHVTTLGKSAKESIISTQHMGGELYAGGVVAAANHLASFCGEVSILTALGEGDPHNAAVEERLDPAIRMRAVSLAGKPTVRKTRFIDQSYNRKLFEVYHMDDTPLAGAEADEFRRCLEEKLEEVDIVVVTDFGHGLITPSIVDLLCEKARFLALNVQTNSGNRGFNLVTKYPRADYLCIDEPELRLACGDKHGSVESLMIERLPQLIDADLAIVTHGRDGCYIRKSPDRIERVPALTQRVVDTVGAGDAFLSYSAPLAAIGVPVGDLAVIGNIAGAIKVDIVGHSASVTHANVLKYFETLLK